MTVRCLYVCGSPTCTLCGCVPSAAVAGIEGKYDLVSVWTLGQAGPLIQLMHTTPLVADILVMEFVQGGRACGVCLALNGIIPLHLINQEGHLV